MIAMQKSCECDMNIVHPDVQITTDTPTSGRADVKMSWGVRCAQCGKLFHVVDVPVAEEEVVAA